MAPGPAPYDSWVHEIANTAVKFPAVRFCAVITSWSGTGSVGAPPDAGPLTDAPSTMVREFDGMETLLDSEPTHTNCAVFVAFDSVTFVPARLLVTTSTRQDGREPSLGSVG